MTATSLFPAQCLLGEGPYWHSARQSFFWVDIENGKLFEHNLSKSTTKTWEFPHRLTVVLEDQDGLLILGLDRKIARFCPETEKLEWLCEVKSEQELNRFNDGKIDATGRIWIGTLSRLFTKGTGSLYSIGKDLIPERKLTDLTISNGMAWTEDNRTFYFIDSPTHQIREFDFNPESGEINFRRRAIKVPRELGTPDGMCIDREGMLWVAHYGGFGVYRWDPKTGKLLEKVKLPVPHVTSCCFGGENLDMLLVTTAQENLTEEDLEKYPESGDVFLVQTNSKGYPSNKFKEL